jgi:ABC-type multidrug transport system fused ATPase/permease subunit
MSVTSVLAIGIFLVLALGAHELFVGALSIGGLVAFYAYETRIFEPVSAAMELYSRTQRMLASARRVREVLDTAPTVPDIGTIQNIPAPLVAGIECERVSFGLPA